MEPHSPGKISGSVYLLCPSVRHRRSVGLISSFPHPIGALHFGEKSVERLGLQWITGNIEGRRSENAVPRPAVRPVRPGSAGDPAGVAILEQFEDEERLSVEPVEPSVRNRDFPSGGEPVSPI